MTEYPFNPDMLILARESQGRTQTELSGLVSCKQGTISKIESGLLVPPPEMVGDFARVLEFPIHFFYQPDRVYGFNSTVFFHRKRLSLADKVLRRLHAQMNITRMRVQRLLRSYPLDSVSQFKRIPAAEYANSIVTIARLVRSSWLLPPGPVRNVTEAIENAGGIVITYDFGTRQADAISEWIAGYPPIFLVNSNVEIPADRLRLTLAHEVGHVIMHESPTPTMEAEANTFAAEFLAPRKEIKGSLLALNMAKLADLKRHWKISMQALIMRAYELKTITESQRRYLFINVAKRGGSRIHEPLESEVPMERPYLFERLIRQHLEMLEYSVSELAQLLFFEDEDAFRMQYLGERRLRLV